MKKVFALVLALTMLCCSAAFAADTDIAILVPNADHGWTGAVMTYAEEKAAAINEEGTYTAQVITSADPANQIAQVEDIIENESANTVVILPLAWGLCRLLGPDGVWHAFWLTEAVTAVVSLVVYRHSIGRRDAL